MSGITRRSHLQPGFEIKLCLVETPDVLSVISSERGVQSSTSGEPSMSGRSFRKHHHDDTPSPDDAVPARRSANVKAMVGVDLGYSLIVG